MLEPSLASLHFGSPSRGGASHRHLQLLDDPRPAWIIRHQRHSHPVPHNHPDEIPSDGTGQVRRHLMPAIELDPNQLARQQLEDNTFRGSVPR